MSVKHRYATRVGDGGTVRGLKSTANPGPSLRDEVAGHVLLPYSNSIQPAFVLAMKIAL